MISEQIEDRTSIQCRKRWTQSSRAQTGKLDQIFTQQEDIRLILSQKFYKGNMYKKNECKLSIFYF